MSQTTDDEGAEELIAGNADSLPTTSFDLDPEARTVRVVAVVLVPFTGFALSGLTAAWLGEDYAGFSGWAFAASACVYVALTLTACLMPRPTGGDGLVLDANLLTLTRAGHQRHWTWRDLGEFTIATRTGPIGWLLGRRISIEIPAMPNATTGDEPADRTATTLHIDGKHLATDNDITAALIAFRDREAAQATPGMPGSPAFDGTFHPRDQQAHTAKTRTLPISAPLLWISAYTSAAVVGGLYDGWQYFVGYWTDPLSHRFALTVATLFALYDVWSELLKVSPARNRLRIDADGLLLAIDGRCRRWQWDAVSAPEIQEVSESEGVTRRCIVFIGRHDGFSSGSQTTPGLLPAALRFVIEDLYDAPLDTIVGRMAESRARFRSDPVAPSVARPEAMPLPT